MGAPPPHGGGAVVTQAEFDALAAELAEALDLSAEEAAEAAREELEDAGRSCRGVVATGGGADAHPAAALADALSTTLFFCQRRLRAAFLLALLSGAGVCAMQA